MHGDIKCEKRKEEKIAVVVIEAEVKERIGIIIDIVDENRHQNDEGWLFKIAVHIPIENVE